MQDILSRFYDLQYDRIYSTKELYLNLIIKGIKNDMYNIIYNIFLNEFNAQDIQNTISKLKHYSKNLNSWYSSINYSNNNINYIFKYIHEDDLYSSARKNIINKYNIQEDKIPERRPDEFNLFNFMNREWLIDYLYNNHKIVSLVS